MRHCWLQLALTLWWVGHGLSYCLHRALHAASAMHTLDTSQQARELMFLWLTCVTWSMVFSPSTCFAHVCRAAQYTVAPPNACIACILSSSFMLCAAPHATASLLAVPFPSSFVHLCDISVYCVPSRCACMTRRMGVC